MRQLVRAVADQIPADAGEEWIVHNVEHARVPARINPYRSAPLFKCEYVEAGVELFGTGLCGSCRCLEPEIDGALGLPLRRGVDVLVRKFEDAEARRCLSVQQ